MSEEGRDRGGRCEEEEPGRLAGRWLPVLEGGRARCGNQCASSKVYGAAQVEERFREGGRLLLRTGEGGMQAAHSHVRRPALPAQCPAVLQ